MEDVARYIHEHTVHRVNNTRYLFLKELVQEFLQVKFLKIGNNIEPPGIIKIVSDGIVRNNQ
jgi:hypothetical protein